MKTIFSVLSIPSVFSPLLLAAVIPFLVPSQSAAFDDPIHQTITGEAANGWLTSAAISRLKPASAYPDLNLPYSLMSDAHCDNCDWDGTGNWITLHREKAVAAAFRYYQTRLDSDYQDFFFHFGFVMHAIQDFYSHANWVETKPVNFLVNLEMPKPAGWVTGTFNDTYDVGINLGMSSCPPGTPSHATLNKDDSSRTGYTEAYQDAVGASREEFRIFQERVRFLNASLGDAVLNQLGFINPNTHKRVCGVFHFPTGTALYFFRGTEYFRLNPATNTVDSVSPPYPRPTAPNWPGVWSDGFDAVVAWNNNKLYFFKGENYIQYDMDADHADAGYPKNIALNWKGVWPAGVNAAINVDNRKAYFFKGEQYIQYDIATNKADAGYPRLIASDWPGLWTDGVDSAVYLGSGKIYFFKGAFYMRYDINTKKPDFANPLPIADNLKGIEVH